MDDNRLREYALNIYKGKSDYTLQKAFRLFPKYFSKIAFFYSELISQKQNELTTRTIQALGIDKAIQIRKIAEEANREIDIFRTKAINDFKLLDEYKQVFLKDKNMAEVFLSGVHKKEKEILTDVRNIALASYDFLESIKKIASYYGFNDIFKEATKYLDDSVDLLLETSNAIKYYKGAIKNGR